MYFHHLLRPPVSSNDGSEFLRSYWHHTGYFSIPGPKPSVSNSAYSSCKSSHAPYPGYINPHFPPPTVSEHSLPQISISHTSPDNDTNTCSSTDQSLLSSATSRFQPLASTRWFPQFPDGSGILGLHHTDSPAGTRLHLPIPNNRFLKFSWWFTHIQCSTKAAMKVLLSTRNPLTQWVHHLMHTTRSKTHSQNTKVAMLMMVFVCRLMGSDALTWKRCCSDAWHGGMHTREILCVAIVRRVAICLLTSLGQQWKSWNSWMSFVALPEKHAALRIFGDPQVKGAVAIRIQTPYSGVPRKQIRESASNLLPTSTH